MECRAWAPLCPVLYPTISIHWEKAHRWTLAGGSGTGPGGLRLAPRERYGGDNNERLLYTSPGPWCVCFMNLVCAVAAATLLYDGIVVRVSDIGSHPWLTWKSRTFTSMFLGMERGTGASWDEHGGEEKSMPMHSMRWSSQLSSLGDQSSCPCPKWPAVFEPLYLEAFRLLAWVWLWLFRRWFGMIWGLHVSCPVLRGHSLPWGREAASLIPPIDKL